VAAIVVALSFVVMASTVHERAAVARRESPENRRGGSSMPLNIVANPFERRHAQPMLQ